MNKKPSQTKEDLLIKISQLESKISDLEKSKSKSSLGPENSPLYTNTVDPEFKLQMSSSGIRELELSDVIDTEVLQSLMDDFYQLTGMLGAVLDVSGKVLVAVGWQDICTKFHRCNPDTLKNCIESDTILSQGVPEGKFKAYQCKNNMWDIVTPLMVGGRHVGNVFMGQYFLEGQVPDYELFRKQARKYGFAEKEYLEALDRVPRFSKETVDKGMQFYSTLARIISTLSFSTIQQSRLLAERKQALEAIMKAKENAEESEEKLKTALESMSEAIFISDIDGNLIDFNEAFATFHKFNNKEECSIALNDYPAFFDVFTPDGEFVPLEMWVVQRALRGESGLNKEYILTIVRIVVGDSGEALISTLH